MAISCCKNCVPPKRHINCHSECEQYLKEKEEHEKLKEYIRAHKDIEITSYDFDKAVYVKHKSCKKRR